MIDTAAARAAESMSRGEDDGRALPSQQSVATLLESMAAALDDAGRPREFAQQTSAGGGGGGGGQPPPLVPPAAELKLLRGIQQAVYDETRDLAEGQRIPNPARRAQRLGELAAEQRELSDTGRRLIESLTPPSPPSSMVVPDPPGTESP